MVLMDSQLLRRLKLPQSILRTRNSASSTASSLHHGREKTKIVKKQSGRTSMMMRTTGRLRPSSGMTELRSTFRRWHPLQGSRKPQKSR